MRESTEMIGYYATDVVTGFHGRVTGAAQYITGSDQVCLTPSFKGQILEGRWFEVERVQIDTSQNHIVIRRDEEGNATVQVTKIATS